VGRPIINRTGLTGGFDVELEFAPDGSLSAAPGAGAAPTTPGQPAGAAVLDIDRPTLFAALQEQLGLKLESRKEQVEVLVIDRAEPPTDN
jgi:uncharacterized protein (TIGR03435 family)